MRQLTAMVMIVLVQYVICSGGQLGARIGIGGEVILYDSFFDSHKIGRGLAARVDLTIGQYTSTSLDLGLRRWATSDSYAEFTLLTGTEIRRIGIIQRGALPLRGITPYLGIGILWQKQRNLSDVFETHFDENFEYGLTALVGVELALPVRRIELDFFTRVESDAYEGDSVLNMLCFGTYVLWRVI